MCSGEESSLLECGHNSLGDSDCEHGEDVGLMCESIHPEGANNFELFEGFLHAVN